MFDKVFKNKYGFYAIKEMPSDQELEAYYANKYYQDSMGGYSSYYDSEELNYINNKIAQKFYIISNLMLDTAHKRFLDVGCGEGWSLKFFMNKGWEVCGLDYSVFGCQNHNPDCLPFLIAGNLYKNLDALIQREKKFECIWLDNVLEHVTDPFVLLTKCRELAHEHTVLVVEVPNDFSELQIDLIKKGCISKAYWIVPPEHLSYFNREGLIAVCEDSGWRVQDVIADYPIDFNLYNPSSNYIENNSVGKDCHIERIRVENLLHQISPEKAINFYRSLADLGLGRQIIGFFKLKETKNA